MLCSVARFMLTYDYYMQQRAERFGKFGSIWSQASDKKGLMIVQWKSNVNLYLCLFNFFFAYNRRVTPWRKEYDSWRKSKLLFFIHELLCGCFEQLSLLISSALFKGNPAKGPRNPGLYQGKQFPPVKRLTEADRKRILVKCCDTVLECMQAVRLELCASTNGGFHKLPW